MDEVTRQGVVENIPYLQNLTPVQRAMVEAIATCFEQANLIEEEKKKVVRGCEV